MNLYIDIGVGPGRSPDGTLDHRRPFRLWGTVVRETDVFYHVKVVGIGREPEY